MSASIPKRILTLVQSLWTERKDLTAATVTDVILADSAMTRLAVEWFAEMALRCCVDKVVRDVAFTGRARRNRGSMSFLQKVTATGMSLLDVRFGDKSLGDYTPAQAREYAAISLRGARTQAVRAHFVAGVAKLCANDDQPIREQVTPEEVLEVKERVCAAAPSRDEALEVLATT